MSAESSLALISKEEPGALVLMRRATDVAGVCKEIVLRTAQSIQGKKYVKVEGWQAIANTFGCVASARDVEQIPGGIRAIGEVRRDGVVIATGEGFVGDDEKTWAQRPMFARRAMAQTRAISRACRAAFAFVVVLMDAGLQTTPAEEMDAVVEAEPQKPAGSGTAALKAKVALIVESPRQSRMTIKESEPAAPGVTMTFGSGKGIPLAQLTPKDLAWYANVLADNVADPDKARFLESNQTALAAVLAEQDRRR